MARTTFDPQKGYFQTTFRGITQKQLEEDSKTPRKISIKEHYFCNGCQRYKVPGLLILKFLKPAVIKIARESKSFPIKRLLNSTLSASSTKESPLYVGENFVFKIQIKVSPEDDKFISKFVCLVEIDRAKDKQVIFTAQVNFIHYILKRKAKKK